MSNIKLARAISKSCLAAHRQSAASMVKHLPESLVAQASSTALAAMIDGLYAACQEAKAIAEREACDQGYIWDARQSKMRDIAA